MSLLEEWETLAGVQCMEEVQEEVGGLLFSRLEVDPIHR